MSGAPERIWVFKYSDQYENPVSHEPSENYPDKEDEYVRADISEAAKAAARAEGERIGMERAAWILEGYASPENSMMADAIRAAMDAKPPQPEYPGDADIDRSLHTAGLLPDFLKPVYRP